MLLFFMGADVFPNFLLLLLLLQIITTPTKAFQLCSLLAPKLSPEVGSFSPVRTEEPSRADHGIMNEPIPAEMNEQAFEAISEELRTVQVMFSF